MDNAWALPVRRVPLRATTDAAVVWNGVYLCYEQRLFGQVTSLSYNHAGSVLGCTSTNQLTLLRVPQSEGALVNEQRERKNYSLRFRDDDKLYIQGKDQRVVVQSCETAFARSFLGHTRDVRATLFLGKHTFVSGSDDNTVRLWDLLHDDALAVGDAHTDYVRCIDGYDAHAFFSGSYDHVVHLWDTRAGLAAPVQSTTSSSHSNSNSNSNNGDRPRPATTSASSSSPTRAVEALCCVAASHLLVCGAGDQVSVFDVRKGLGHALVATSLHTKTVTALAYAAAEQTLLTGSLDCRVKMLTFDGSELHCVASKRLRDGVAALAVHPDSQQFAVGAVSGDVHVFDLTRARATTEAAAAAEAMTTTTTTTLRARDEVLQKMLHTVEHQLRSYQYGKALKTALYSRQVDVVVSTLEELLRRGVLHVALSGHNDRTIARLLRYTIALLDKPQFADTMMAVLEDVVAIYASAITRSAYLYREVRIARKRIAASMAALSRMTTTMSIMEMVVDAA